MELERAVQDMLHYMEHHIDIGMSVEAVYAADVMLDIVDDKLDPHLRARVYTAYAEALFYASLDEVRPKMAVAALDAARQQEWHPPDVFIDLSNAHIRMRISHLIGDDVEFYRSAGSFWKAWKFLKHLQTQTDYDFFLREHNMRYGWRLYEKISEVISKYEPVASFVEQLHK